MKYLKKLFEKENDKYWIVIYADLKYGEISHEDLFDDEESAKNLFLTLVNDEKERMFEFADKEFTQSDVIINSIVAEKWVEENVSDVRISYSAILVQGKYDLPDKIKIVMNANKFKI